MRRIAIAALAGLTLASAPLAAQEAPAPRSGQWEIDYGERSCRLSRTTGGAEPIIFSLRLSPANAMTEMILVNPSWPRGRSLSNRVDIVLQPSEERSSHDARNARVPATEHRFLTLNELDPSFLDRVARAAALRVEADGRELVAVRLPNAAGAVRALRQCNDDLLSGWGVDVALLNGLRERPRVISDPPVVFMNDDYPTGAMLNRASGTVVIRYTVGVDGRVGDCAPVESSGHRALDDRACSVMLERARYSPAVGADGEPVAVQLVMPVHWVLP